MIIDSHIHFWDLSNNLNTWVKDTDLPKMVCPVDFEIDNFVHIEAHDDNIDNLAEYKWLKNNFKNKTVKVIAFIDFTQSIALFEHKIISLSAYKDIC